MSSVKVALPVIGVAGCGGLPVEKVIQRLPGILDVYVNCANETAYVKFEPGKVTEEQIAQAIRDCGYRTILPARALDEA